MGPDSYNPVERYATGTKAARHGTLVRRHLQRIEGLALATTVSTLRNLKRWPSPKQQYRRCQLTEAESVLLSFRNMTSRLTSAMTASCSTPARVANPTRSTVSSFKTPPFTTLIGHCTGTFTARSVAEGHTLPTVKNLEFGSFYLGSREDHHTRLRADRRIGIVQATSICNTHGSPGLRRAPDSRLRGHEATPIPGS
jgi:hypothetical protein